MGRTAALRNALRTYFAETRLEEVQLPLFGSRVLCQKTTVFGTSPRTVEIDIFPWPGLYSSPGSLYALTTIRWEGSAAGSGAGLVVLGIVLLLSAGLSLLGRPHEPQVYEGDYYHKPYSHSNKPEYLAVGHESSYQSVKQGKHRPSDTPSPMRQPSR